MILMLIASVAFAAQDTTLTAADGVKLHARTEPVAGSTRGVVLVHMLGRNAGDWDLFAEKLARSGFQTIAVDLRGHGDSDLAGQELSPTDYQNMLHDVNAAAGWLRDQGVTDINCVGASIGANLCLQAAAANADFVNVVLLSPGLNYKGIATPSALKEYGNRPLLIVASEEDSVSNHAAGVLLERALGQAHLETLQGAGHGSRMLNRDPGLEGLVRSWLLGTYELGNGEVVVPRPAMTVDASQMQTEGTKLQSHQ
ncbi:MAG: alpha/beta fold hydrolase [Deltaproteobacteria bacterium]|nr:MAG: alpha/beta fold hydrolase [Deltaproteobacteria bacterium]